MGKLRRWNCFSSEGNFVKIAVDGFNKWFLLFSIIKEDLARSHNFQKKAVATYGWRRPVKNDKVLRFNSDGFYFSDRICFH